MKFGIPQIIFTAWLLLGLGIMMAKHGEPREGKCNFWSGLLSTALQVILLYCGGFYG